MKPSVLLAITALTGLVATTTHAACISVAGLVSSTPDPACQIGAVLGTAHVSEPFDPPLFVVAPQVPDTCFALSGQGSATFTGFSALTTVAVVDALGQNLVSITPMVFPVPPSSVRFGMKIFTSEAALTGSIRTTGKKKSGTIYTKDTGTITPDGKVGQVLRVIGGEQDFLGATGTIAVAGQELGGFAIYNGEICTPN